MTFKEYQDKYSTDKKYRKAGITDIQIKKIRAFNLQVYNEDYHEECVCKEFKCKETVCKGQCKCKYCHESYMDFLSYRE